MFVMPHGGQEQVRFGEPADRCARKMARDVFINFRDFLEGNRDGFVADFVTDSPIHARAQGYFARFIGFSAFNPEHRQLLGIEENSWLRHGGVRPPEAGKVGIEEQPIEEHTLITIPEKLIDYGGRVITASTTYWVSAEPPETGIIIAHPYHMRYEGVLGDEA